MKTTIKPLLAALTLLFLLPLARAETAASVAVDATAAPQTAMSPAPLPDALQKWGHWVHLDDGKPLAPLAPPGLTAAASRFPGGVGVVVTNTSEQAVPFHVDILLPAGLWRAEAALVGAAETDNRSWRMESALRRERGVVSKPLTLQSGQTLCLRMTETVAGAQAAYRAAAVAKEATDNTWMRGRVARALGPVGGVLNVLPTLVARGDRTRIVKLVHRALLTAAQAQALWDNTRGSSATARDNDFDHLMTALSEISCAAYNLVPGQSATTDARGDHSVQITVTNAGTHTVPLVSLGVQTVNDSVNRRVFGSLTPGEHIAATFAATDETRGIIQFILGMGAAVVPAAPLP